MKRFLLFTLLTYTCVANLHSQDWQNICPKGTTLYVGDSSRITAFRLDSVYVTGDGDSVFLSYRTIRRPLPPATCLDTTQGSLLGRIVIKRPDGIFLFRNYSNDTIWFNTQASLNQTWKFCNLPDGGYIDATVATIGQKTILGQPDEVKQISFQARNAQGVAVPHTVNGKTILLGRHSGLASMFDVYPFPLEVNLSILAGKTNPPEGIRDLSCTDIFNFQPGDVFHYSGYHNDAFVHPNSQYWRTMFTVISRQDFVTGDSVGYTMERCMHFTNRPYYAAPVVQLIHDTLQLLYCNKGGDGQELMMHMPGEFVPYGSSFGSFVASDYSRYFDTLTGRQSQVELSTPYGRAAGSDCWSINMAYYYRYEEGLGKTFSYAPTLYYYPLDRDTLVYYKKGSITSGTPLAASCSELLDVDNEEVFPMYAVTVFPNPAHENVTVRVSGPGKDVQFSYTLCDLFGREVAAGNFSGGLFVFHRNKLSDGVYLLHVSDQNGRGLGTSKLLLN